MQIKTRFTEDGEVSVEVIDPSDGAISHQATVNAGEQIVVTATDTHSPAGIEFGEVEATPEPEAEAAEGDAGNGNTVSGDGDPQGEAPVGDEPGQAERTDTPEGGEPAAA